MSYEFESYDYETINHRLKSAIITKTECDFLKKQKKPRCFMRQCKILIDFENNIENEKKTDWQIGKTVGAPSIHSIVGSVYLMFEFILKVGLHSMLQSLVCYLFDDQVSQNLVSQPQ